jgi:hypothetical protein
MNLINSCPSQVSMGLLYSYLYICTICAAIYLRVVGGVEGECAADPMKRCDGERWVGERLDGL